MTRCAPWTLAVLTLCFVVPSAPACMNDTETPKGEQEFKSRYQQDQPYVEPESKNQLLVFGGAGLGMTLLTGAVVMGATRSRRS